MNPLPQTTIDSIAREADVFCNFSNDNETNDIRIDGYKMGAEREAARALPLYEALKQIQKLIFDASFSNVTPNDGKTLDCVNVVIGTALASYDAGEAPEPAPSWYSKTSMKTYLINNQYSEKISEELSEQWARDCQAAFKKGWEKAFNDKRQPDEPYIYAKQEPWKEVRTVDPNPLTKEALIEEIWAMLPNDCKQSLTPIKDSWLDSVMADIESYCDGRAGKEGKEFAKWVAMGYSPDYNSIGGIKQWTASGTYGPFYSMHELYTKWQQSKNQQP